MRKKKNTKIAFIPPPSEKYLSRGRGARGKVGRFIFLCYLSLLVLSISPKAAVAEGGGAQPPQAAPQATYKPFGDLLKKTAEKAGYNITIPEGEEREFFLNLLGQIAFALLTLLGIFFLSLTLYGGFRWMFARGNEDEVKKGRDIIKHALVGLIIVSSAYAIWLTIQKFLF